MPEGLSCELGTEVISGKYRRGSFFLTLTVLCTLAMMGCSLCYGGLGGSEVTNSHNEPGEFRRKETS